MGKLHALKIRSLAEPGRYADGDGLFLDVTGKASARWILRIQSNERRREIGLGSLKNVSLADARDAAFMTRKKIAQGIDPVAERKQERQAIPTFRKAAELVHEEHENAWKNGKHQNQWIATLKTYAFPKMGELLVSDIEGPLIRDVLAPIDWQSPRLRGEYGSASAQYSTGHMLADFGRPRRRCDRFPKGCLVSP